MVAAVPGHVDKADQHAGRIRADVDQAFASTSCQSLQSGAVCHEGQPTLNSTLSSAFVRGGLSLYSISASVPPLSIAVTLGPYSASA